MSGFLFYIYSMEKVKLTRSHNEHSQGDTVEVTPEQKNYYEGVGLIEKVKKEVKTDKTKVEKK